MVEQQIEKGVDFMTNSIKRKLAVWTAVCMALVQGTLLPTAAADTDPDFSELGAVGVFDAEETQKIASVIYEGLASHSSTIRLNGRGMPTIGVEQESIDSLGAVYRSVIAGWDVGILTTKNSMSFSMSSTGIVAISPKYLVEDAQYESEYNAMTALMDEAVAEVNDDWSDAEKALYIHEWMADEYDYDYNEYATSDENYLRHTAYGLLKRDIGVCEGYAWLYTLLLNRVGVESTMVTSINLNHAWNMLEINGDWYHVDVTWDDVFAGHPGHLQHTSFLKSEAAMVTSGHHTTDWTFVTEEAANGLADSTKYDDAFWTESNITVRPCTDGTWLMMTSAPMDPTNASFLKCTFNPEDGSYTSESLMTLSERWLSFEDPSMYYNTTYIVPEMYNGDLYYVTSSSVFAIRNGIVVWLFNLTDEQKEQGYIYGMKIDDGVMQYCVSPSLYEDSVAYTADLHQYQGMIDASAGTYAPEETTTETTTTTEEITTTKATTATEETTTTTTQPTKPIVNGDANGDGVLTVVDIVALQRYLFGKSTITAENAKCVDLTRDGRLNGFDLALLKRTLLHKGNA